MDSFASPSVLRHRRSLGEGETVRILFVEPPKDYWFLMGEYLPPPTGLLALAAYVEEQLPDVEVRVLDCQAEGIGWDRLEKRISSAAPSVVAASGMTCNAYVCARIAETAKRIDAGIVTVLGGQHFTTTPEESLEDFPEIDYIVRGEGEQTIVGLLRTLREGGDLGQVEGLSFRHDGHVVHTPPRPLIEDLDALPFPAYHLVEEHLGRYHFTMMAGRNKRYLILEGSRGCRHKCVFCTQWRHWNAMWRTKSPGRIGDEMEHLRDAFGGQFLWLTDDNFDYPRRGRALWEELHRRGFTDEVAWFCQARTDDIVRNPDLVAKLRSVGNSWVLLGIESDSPEALRYFRKGTRAGDAVEAVRVLNENGIFTQSMLVLGARRDSEETIEALRRFSMELSTDLAIFTVLTPFPGTEVHAEAQKNGWIEDTNYANYDMAHAIMPTQTLARMEVQEQLYRCYRSFYGSIPRGVKGLFAKNEIKRRAYRHMAAKRVLHRLRTLA